MTSKLGQDLRCYYRLKYRIKDCSELEVYLVRPCLCLLVNVLTIILRDTAPCLLPCLLLVTHFDEDLRLRMCNIF